MKRWVPPTYTRGESVQVRFRGQKRWRDGNVEALIPRDRVRIRLKTGSRHSVTLSTSSVHLRKWGERP
jgi:hypothetical protein